MKLALARGGGVTGVRRPPIEIDTNDLAPAARERLRALVDAARPSALPRELDTAVPDQVGYTLTMTDDGGTTHSVDFSLADAPPALRALVTELRQLAGTR